MLLYSHFCFPVALNIFKGLKTMQGSWSTGLHVATVVHKPHPLNLSCILLDLVPELPPGHLQGQMLGGVKQEHPGTAGWYSKGLVETALGIDRGDAKRHSEPISPSFLCVLESFHLLPTSPPSLLRLHQKPPAPPTLARLQLSAACEGKAHCEDFAPELCLNFM